MPQALYVLYLVPLEPMEQALCPHFTNGEPKAQRSEVRVTSEPCPYHLCNLFWPPEPIRGDSALATAHRAGAPPTCRARAAALVRPSQVSAGLGSGLGFRRCPLEPVCQGLLMLGSLWSRGPGPPSRKSWGHLRERSFLLPRIISTTTSWKPPHPPAPRRKETGNKTNLKSGKTPFSEGCDVGHILGFPGPVGVWRGLGTYPSPSSGLSSLHFPQSLNFSTHMREGALLGCVWFSPVRVCCSARNF